MTKVSDIYDFLDEIAPFNTAMEGDNCGLLIGGFSKNVSSAILALDITEKVLNEATEKKAQLIIAHHPIIYHPLRKLPEEGIAHKLITAGVNVICAHTNLDIAPEGVNEVYMELLELSKIENVEGTGGCTALATCPEHLSDVWDLAKHIKKTLGSDALRVCDGGKPIKTAAVCCGGGGSFFEAVVASKADVFITGDLKYAQAVDAQRGGLSLIDVPHFDSEHIILKPLSIKLVLAFPSVRFEVASAENSSFQHI